ncbi:MAG: division/cell wall cluster transcriptional repressor MraZ [Gammaproteobacteria bacterium]|nr:division/cell wall cluster transcriptional repressor MraZ [Gammaproteobacteria bacterium]
MFRGINVINLDPKGRIAIPTRYRPILVEKFGNRVVVTIDTEQRCLLLYPYSEWEAIEKKVANLSSFHPMTRRIQRLLIGHATELNLDSHGRILLPPLLRDYANIDKRVVMIGQSNKFEMWSEEKWEKSREVWLAQEPVKENELPEELRTISL